ncbi:hypothetical protein O6H91_08G095600 [Diphasiastrum complanatum]|uniref:Uncharacterized protein n=1 Tax=Diphasiastrum complanatum TaxID=34168 RepID=A0ACC2CZY6_DIPCM|nr:hypothetical protein O6H91_08G095600 [Diphasiastrum complanatum]
MAGEKRKAEAMDDPNLEASLDSAADSDTHDIDEATAASTPVAPIPAAVAGGKATKKFGKLAKKKKSSVRLTSPTASDEDEEGGRIAIEQEGKAGNSGARDDEEEEDHSEVELARQQTIDPDRMQAILASFTSEQMSRYECYRRSGFQRANMRRLLQSVAGCPISIPMTIVMSGIAKMFVGELVELGRIVMTERKESGPIRPRHVREAYRRLKLEGKVPSRSRQPLFH